MKAMVSPAAALMVLTPRLFRASAIETIPRTPVFLRASMIGSALAANSSASSC
jgi:hypothetical protein